SLHVLFGFERDTYRWHRLVKTYAAGPGFALIGGDRTADWAVLKLAEPVPALPLSLDEETPRTGMPVMLAGYNQDRAQLLLADTDCRIERVMPIPGGGRFLSHDCAGTRG